MADTSLLFFAVAGFAVFFVALAKAGFGGMIGSLGMPLVASVSDIQTAITILLPTYVVMDLIVAVIYRKSVPFALLWRMALAGIAGVLLAAYMFQSVNPDLVAILLGIISLLLGLRFFRDRVAGGGPVLPATPDHRWRWRRGVILNGASGFTSFFLMGEAPVQAFVLPLRLAPQVYVALLVWFFFIVNWIKIPIVLSMGLVTIDSLWISALLLPIMPVGILVGKFIATRIRREPFYVIVHVLLIALGCYLIASGAWHLQDAVASEIDPVAALQ
ncbi:sulfite exporter TauE/SafE family protein [Loktanella sp. DJP18]|uniref:sulfite exporter TauE/SafE family protein n=1 Tax=Loktanella sp. DJP18 TaxID=3409788 RepID=UPI003BB53671